jgi:adenine phosphoribosyltransferase
VKNPAAFSFVVDSIVKEFSKKGITKVVALEARGFIFGGALANKLDAGFVPVRKKGKLPYKVITETYQLEYGEDRIEMHIDGLEKNDVVLIHDDILATGGTALATLNLVKKLGVDKVFFSFVCDLEFIDTPQKQILQDYDKHVLVKYS